MAKESEPYIFEPTAAFADAEAAWTCFVCKQCTIRRGELVVVRLSNGRLRHAGCEPKVGQSERRIRSTVAEATAKVANILTDRGEPFDREKLVNFVSSRWGASATVDGLLPESFRLWANDFIRDRDGARSVTGPKRQRTKGVGQSGGDGMKEIP